jgi:hypothetical protein
MQSEIKLAHGWQDNKEDISYEWKQNISWLALDLSSSVCIRAWALIASLPASDAFQSLSLTSELLLLLPILTSMILA